VAFLPRRFSRRRLDNSRIRYVEGTHVEKIAAREPSSEPAGQIGRELINYFFAVLRLGFSGLFELNNVLANQPVCCGHEGVNRSRGSATRLVDQSHNVVEHRVVIS